MRARIVITVLVAALALTGCGTSWKNSGGAGPGGTINVLAASSLTQAGFPYGSGTRTMWFAPDKGLVKLVFRRDNQALLGCSIFGEGACEMIHVAAAVMSFGGSIDYFIQAVFNYPTLGDAYKYAAYDGLQRLAKRNTTSTGLPRVR